MLTWSIFFFYLPSHIVSIIYRHRHLTLTHIILITITFTHT